MSSRPGSNRPTMQKPKPGLSKRLIRKIESGALGKFCHAKQYKGGLDVGRNQPCPCGKTREDGTPVKFKMCHGR